MYSVIISTHFHFPYVVYISVMYKLTTVVCGGCALDSSALDVRAAVL